MSANPFLRAATLPLALSGFSLAVFGWATGPAAPGPVLLTAVGLLTIGALGAGLKLRRAATTTELGPQIDMLVLLTLAVAAVLALP